jgi:hypothetical protein
MAPFTYNNVALLLFKTQMAEITRAKQGRATTMLKRIKK